MLRSGSYSVLWHLIGWCNPSQAAKQRRALCRCSAKLIDLWYRLREMIDWLRLVRWQTMQRLAHQGAALSVAIIPDCLCFPPHTHPLPMSTSSSTPLGLHICVQAHKTCTLLRHSHTCNVHVNTHLWIPAFICLCLKMRLVHCASFPPLLTLSRHPATQALVNISSVSKRALFFYTPACVFVHACVCVCVLCLCVCVGVPPAAALHIMSRAEQPMAQGLSRILFILLLILKN